MDYHSLKRKELQALCKKHGIPANTTNLVMADKLTALLKENEKPVTRGKSCLRSIVDQPDETFSDGLNRQSKKVRFSPENETFEFLKSEARQEKLGRGMRRKSISVVKLDDIVSTKNAGSGKFSRENSKSPIKLTRSRAEKVTCEGEYLAETKRVKRGSRSIAEGHVAAVEGRVTRRSSENKNVESKEEVTDDALPGVNLTKRSSRKSSLKIDVVVSESELTSRKGTEEPNDDLGLKKNQSQRTSRRTTKLVEDPRVLNPGLGEVEVVGRGRTKRQHNQLSEAKVTNTKLKTSTDTEGVLEVEKPLKGPSRYSTRRQSIMPHTEKLGAEDKNSTQVQTITSDENTKSRRSSTRSKSTEVPEITFSKNETKKKTRSGKRDPVLEKENTVIKESTLVEEAPRRSSRNANRRQSIMPQTEKIAADGPKGSNGNINQLKSSNSEEKDKLGRSFSRRKSNVVSDLKVAENLSNNKPTSRRLDQVQEGKDAEAHVPKKSTRNGAQVGKSLAKAKTGKAVARKKLKGTTEEPEGKSDEKTIPFVEPVALNSQSTMGDVAERSNILVTKSSGVSSNYDDEEIQGEIHSSDVEIGTEIKVDEIKLCKDFVENEDRIDSDDMAPLIESEVEVKTVEDGVSYEASHGEEGCPQIEQPDCTDKASENLDLENELGMDEYDDMKEEVSDYVRQEDNKGTQAKLVMDIDVEEPVPDENNTDSSSAMPCEAIDAENSSSSEDKHFLEPEAVCDTFDGEKNTASALKAKERHEIERSIVVGEVSELLLGKGDCYLGTEGDGNVEHDFEGHLVQSKGINNTEENLKITYEKPAECSFHISARKEVTPAEMEKLNDEAENLEHVGSVNGENVKRDFENESYLAHDNGRVLNIDFVIEEDKESSFPDASYQTTASKVEEQQDQAKIYPSGSKSLEPSDSRSQVSMVKRETIVEKIVVNNSSDVKVMSLVEAANGVMPDIDVAESVQNPIWTSRGDGASNLMEQQHSTTVATPISLSNEIRSLLLINSDKTPASEFGKAQNLMLAEDHAASASATVEQVEVLKEKLHTLSAASPTSFSSKIKSLMHINLDKTPGSEYGTRHNLMLEEDCAASASAAVEQVEVFEEQQLPTRAATPVSFSNEMKTPMPINQDRTPDSHNSMLPEDHATSASATIERVDVWKEQEHLISAATSILTSAATPVSLSNEIKTPMPIYQDKTPASHNSMLPEDHATPASATVERVDVWKEQEHLTSAATPISLSTEIKSLMLINLDETPASEFGRTHNSMLQADHYTTASATVERVEVLNKVLNENASGFDHHSPLHLRNLVDKPKSPFTSLEDPLLEKSESLLCTETPISSQEAEGGCRSEPQENEGTVTGSCADHNTVTTGNETQPFQETSPQTTGGQAECQDVAEGIRSPGFTSRDNVYSVEKNNSIRPATPFSVLNEIRSLMMVNLDSTSASGFGVAHKLAQQGACVTSAIRTVELEGLNNVTNEGSREVHHISPFLQEDHSDKPNEVSSLLEDFEMEKSGQGMCADNAIVSEEAHDSYEPSILRRFGDDCLAEPQKSERAEAESEEAHNSNEQAKLQGLGIGCLAEPQECEGAEAEFNADTVSDEGDTQPSEATPCQQTRGNTEQQGNGRSNVEVSPTALRLLFDDKQHEDDSGSATQSNNDDDINEVDIYVGDLFDSEEVNINAVSVGDLLSPSECKYGDTQTGSCNDNFVATPCVESIISAGFTVASASKSISKIDILEVDNQGIGERVLDDEHENAPKETNVPGDSDTLPDENAERTFTLSIKKADIVDKDQDDFQMDASSRNPEELRPVSFDLNKYKMVPELCEGISTALDKLSTEIEGVDFVNTSEELGRDVTRVEEGMFDDLDGHEMEMVQEMFQGEEVDSPSDSEFDSFSDSDHCLSHEKALAEDNSLEKEETESMEKPIDGLADFMSQEVLLLEDFLGNSQEHYKSPMVADESPCHKSSSGNLVELNECADKHNSSQAFHSWLRNPEFGNSQDRLGGDMFSSWKPNVCSESKATKSSPAVSNVISNKEDEKAVGTCEKQLGADEAHNVNYDVLETALSHIPTGDATESFDLVGTEVDRLLGVNVAPIGEMTVDEATEPSEASTRSDSIAEDSPSDSAYLGVHGGKATEDQVIITNPLDEQEQLNSSRNSYHDVGACFEDEDVEIQFNFSEGKFGTAAGGEHTSDVDLSKDHSPTVSSLFPAEGDDTEASEEVPSEIIQKEINSAEFSEMLTVQTVETLDKEESFDDTEALNLSQDFTPYTKGDVATAVLSSSDENRIFEFASSAVKEGSVAEDDTKQNMDFHDVGSAHQEEQKGEIPDLETNSTMWKTEKRKSSLILGTPKKVAGTFDLKENAQSVKRENLGSVTAAKSTTKRRALMYLPR